VSEWELAELTAQAAVHNGRIIESETSVLDDYWLLGRLLERVRANFKRGTWLPWLDRRGIDRTRAKRARLLAEVFASIEKLRGLSLHEALRVARERKKGQAGDAKLDRTRQFKSALNKLLAMPGELAADETARGYSFLADEVGAAAAALRRACRKTDDVEVAQAAEPSADLAAPTTSATTTPATSGPCGRRAVIDELERPAQEPFAPTGFIPVERMVEPELVGSG
jgi:hypothetical protein